jgi:hypothetical protein
MPERFVCGKIARTAWTACLMLLFGLTAASAEPCNLSGPRYRLVGDTVRWSLAIERGHSCVRGLRSADVTLDGVELVSKPQSGQVKLLGWGFTYSSAARVAESDTFTLAVVGKINRKPGASTIEVTVSVVAPDRELPASHAVGSPPALSTVAPSASQPAIDHEAPSPMGGPLPQCPIWDWSKGAPPPMRPPFDRSKLFCPPSPFRRSNPPIGCICP